MDVMNIIFSVISVVAFVYTALLITFCDKFERNEFFSRFYRIKIILYILIIYWMIRLVLVL